MKKIECFINSKRNTQLATTIVESQKENGGLVIFVHGFKADRTEGGRFLTVAEELAKDNINSIMVSFPGCGDSQEPFENYCVSNCLDDIDSMYQYMLDNYSIDSNRLAMVGYSMGGRLTSIYSSQHKEFKTIALWAAATYNGFDNNETFLDNNVEDMIQQARNNGFALAYNTFDNSYLHISERFFDDMFSYQPFDCLCQYQGNVLLVHGDADPTVSYDVSVRAYQGLTTKGNKKLVTVANANHGFGLWDDHLEQSAILTGETIDFLRSNL
ncbi:MAG: alpha/beta hydrolase family protein [Erysipelotrichaceae bacterium]